MYISEMFYTFDIFNHYESKEGPTNYPIQSDELAYMINVVNHLANDVANRFDVAYGCIYKNELEFEKHSKILQSTSLYTCDFVVDEIYIQHDENNLMRAFVADIIFIEESQVYMENKPFLHKCKIQPGFYEDRIITLGLILPVRYVYKRN